MGWMIAQAIKFFLSLRKDGINWKDFVQSGGMPSSHSSFMVSIATVVGISQGIKSAIFAIVASVTAIVIYDSLGVRRTTGDQTEAILELSKYNRPTKVIIHNSRGHNIAEVIVGCLVGLLVGLVLQILFG